MSENPQTLQDEIDAAIEAEPDEEDDVALEQATLEPTATGWNTGDPSLMLGGDTTRSIGRAREEAQIPEQLSIKDLEGHTFTIVRKAQQKAFLPADGSLRPGYQCLCKMVADKKVFTVWIGQTALKRDLDSIDLPVRVTVAKKGRSYRFI